VSIIKDYQKGKVYKAEILAEELLKRGEEIYTLTRGEVVDFVNTTCKHERVKPPAVEFDTAKPTKNGIAHAAYDVEPPTITVYEPQGMTDVCLAHELAHHLTDPAFPYHGVEWVRAYLRLLDRWCSPHTHKIMKNSFLREGVHLTGDERIKRVRRVAVNIANTKPGTEANLVMDNPPQSATAKIHGYNEEALLISVGTKKLWMPFERMRYLETV
jgi:hypothetical protein